MTVLDWSGSKGAPRARVAGTTEPCKHCGGGALLRHPVTGEPCHKICEEAMLTIAPVILALVTIRHRYSGGTHA